MSEMRENGDDILVSNLLRGDVQAPGEFVDRYFMLIKSHCFARVGVGDDIDDLVQETFLRAHKALPSLKEPKKFKAWLKGIASRVCWDHIDDQKKKRAQFSSLNNVEEFTVAVPSENPQIDHMGAALKSLPEIYREVLVAKYYEGKSYVDIADELKLTPAGINARMTKAKKMLKEYLEKVHL